MTFIPNLLIVSELCTGLFLYLPILGTSCRSSCRYDIRYSLTLFVCDWISFRDVYTFAQMKLSPHPFRPPESQFNPCTYVRACMYV